jgi:hypothetical protein
VSNTVRWSRQSPLQSVLLAGLLLFFVSHFVLLSPSSLEDDFGGMRVIHPRDLLGLLQNESETLALNRIPADTPPSYSLRDIRLASSHHQSPELLLLARKTASYQKAQLTHFRDIEAKTAEGITLKAREALQDLQKNEILFLGSVEVRFPAGTEILTETATLITRPRTRVRIPDAIAVRGLHVRDRNTIRFSSLGLEYDADSPEHLHLLHRVRVETRGTRQVTILSDSADYTESRGLLVFSMLPNRPLVQQFVRLEEPSFELQARFLELDLSRDKEVEMVRAEKDVSFKDTGRQDQVTSGTGGKALYALDSGRITLSEFPQLYQDRDTITGDIILFHRDSDTIEVRQSNASYGN